MLENVLAMYATPSTPLFRPLSSGLISVEALKIAIAKAEHESMLGWHVILAKNGSKKAAAVVAQELVERDFTAQEVLAVIKYLLPMHLCKSCGGTGLINSHKQKRIISCRSCRATGTKRPPLKDVCKKVHASFAHVEKAVDLCLVEASNAERVIKQFLKKEKDAQVDD